MTMVSGLGGFAKEGEATTTEAEITTGAAKARIDPRVDRMQNITET